MQQNKDLHKVQLIVTIVGTILSTGFTMWWYYYNYRKDQDAKKTSELPNNLR